MDRACASDLFLDDQYIPSGNWESQIEEISSTSNCCYQYSSSFPSPYELSQPADACHSTVPSIPNQDTSNNNNENEGPFSIKCRIPVPDLVPVSGYQLWLETSFMCRRNERERQRVRNVNDGFSRLRNHLPRSAQMKRRQSKVETLRHAISYIRQLQTLLEDKKTSGVSDKSS